ncbi:MAG TPA: D-sedoheptulose 7-phosphate isomerase [Pyrinomonadaceae bacterium]|nr:D-sedoheptulose 7-phosphate isomerase [Pyrinomonadaceae bacterium]
MSKVVFTNGCFDLIHPGHIDLLNKAKALGDKLVVGINSDASVRQMKGAGRPVVSQDARKAVLLGLKAVDEVVIFDELTPEKVIRDIRPNVLVKGGDWPVDQIVGAEFVKENGGEVVSIPLVDGYSTSTILARINADDRSATSEPSDDAVSASINEHCEVFAAFEDAVGEVIRNSAKLISETFASGGKVLICGNGGSAADAQHIAAEFVGRYETERIALPAIALTTDTSALTALANDYDFERIFSRQVEALGREGDCLIAISTSGNSPNILAAVMSARSRGLKVIGFTGADGKRLAGLSDIAIMVPSARTARIQEGHITAAHIICELIDIATPAGE